MPFIDVLVPSGLGAEAVRLGRLVHEHSQRAGAHRTPAAEQGNDVISHAKGKYGELVFSQWLTYNNITASHNPFRDDYTKKVMEDDFVVMGTRIEVKAKQRGIKSSFPPLLHYNVNLGKKSLENAIHVFIEISGKSNLASDPEALIVGWATPNLISERGQQVWPGKQSDNNAFPFKRYDWDIAIGDLSDPNTLYDNIKSGTIKGA